MQKVNRKKQALLQLLLLVLPFGLLSQNITISGNVFGFLGEKVLLLRKASKNVSFEGPVSGARITLKGNNVNTSAVTDITGTYSLTIKDKGSYQLQVERQGYSTVVVALVYTDAGLKTYYPATSFILKKDDNSNNNLGEMLIDQGGRLSYNSDKSSKKSTTDVLQSNQLLLDKAAQINNSSATNVINIKAAAAPIVVKTATIEEGMVKVEPADTVVPKEMVLPVAVMDKLLNDTVTNTDSLKAFIENYERILVTMNPADRNYKLLKMHILNAQKRLKHGESIITLQNGQLSESRKKMWFLTLFGFFALLSVILLLFVLRQRKKHLQVLDEKNKSISRINAKLTSSIRYAATIQGNFFKDKKWLSKLFGKSFIFNMPKDMLSGDFYWFSHKDGSKIVVAADCTGHGVPGALLTMLGHSILEDVVNVKGETQPSRILAALCQALISAFARHDELEYGMDLTVISARDGSDELTFSGITNGLYMHSGGKLTYYPVTPKSIGPDINAGDLKDQVIKVSKGDCIYMLSDGYSDQFGDNQENPHEKFNITRLEELLSRLSSDKDFSASEMTLKSEFETWKGSREQLDDVLVLGIQVD